MVDADQLGQWMCRCDGGRHTAPTVCRSATVSTCGNTNQKRHGCRCACKDSHMRDFAGCNPPISDGERQASRRCCGHGNHGGWRNVTLTMSTESLRVTRSDGIGNGSCVIHELQPAHDNGTADDCSAALRNDGKRLTPCNSIGPRSQTPHPRTSPPPSTHDLEASGKHNSR